MLRVGRSCQLPIQFLAVADNGEILAEREVLNGSGRAVGIEYDITAEILVAIDEAIAQQANMEDTE